MAAINCCNFDESCKDIVTLGYMKQMADMGGCAQVSGGSAFTSCCDADASAYTPTYGEISGGTYAPIRTYNDANPSNDVDGFSAITSGDYDGCCGNIDASGKCVTRDELFYGTTELSSITLSLTQSPSQCDTNFTVEETDTYIRRIYTCSGDSIVQSDSTQAITSAETTSALTKSYGEITTNIDSSTSIISGVATSQVSFNTVTVTVRKKKRACDEAESVSKSISVTGQPYTDSVIILCPKTMTCEGEEISAKTSSVCTNTNEVVLSSSTLDNSPFFSSSTSGDYIVYKVDENTTNVPQSTFKLNFKIGDKDGFIEVTFNRDSCTIGPSRANPTPCGAFPVEDDWCNSSYKDDIVIHNASGGTVTC